MLSNVAQQCCLGVHDDAHWPLLIHKMYWQVFVLVITLTFHLHQSSKRATIWPAMLFPCSGCMHTHHHRFSSKAAVWCLLGKVVEAYVHADSEMMLCCQEGAVDVFLDFISYSGGPLAEDLLEVITRPVSILWGRSRCVCTSSYLQSKGLSYHLDIHQEQHSCKSIR